MRRSRRIAAMGLATVAVASWLASAHAQQQGYQQPPPQQGYQQPPPQQGYQQPPPRPQRQVVPYEPGMTIPPGGHIERHRDMEMLVSGLATFLGWYGATLIVASILMAHDDPDDVVTGRRLTIPIAGPFAVIPRASGAKPKVWLVLDGLAQAVGLIGFIGGVVGSDRYLVYYARGPAERPLALTPTAGPGGGGLRLRF